VTDGLEFARALAELGLWRPAGRSRRRWRSVDSVSRDVEDLNRRMLRARDAMDRRYAEPLDVPAVAAVAHVSEAHFIRTFRAVFGETPHRYLQRRRVERSMFLLRETDRSITDICLDVGFNSLGTFSRTFRQIVGETPSHYRQGHGPIVAPHCVQLAAMRPRFAASKSRGSSSFGEAAAVAGP
jgi:AraC-like DNA-binding protein